MTFFSVDIEADGPAPGPYSMLSAGFVAVRRGLADRFYCELSPISNQWLPEALEISGLDRDELTRSGEDPDAAMTRLRAFIAETTVGRPTFISDNPGFDFSFVNYYLHVFNASEDPNPNPFGHSSRRIGDLWAGLAGDAAKSSDWKDMRQTSHTHNALDDAVGNAEALLEIRDRGLTIDLR